MFSLFQIGDLPQASYLQQTIVDLNIGTYSGVEVRQDQASYLQQTIVDLNIDSYSGVEVRP